MLTLIDDIARSGARISTTLDGLTDAAAREPSGLPGWSRAHVVTHLTHAMDAYIRLLATARAGTAPAGRPDPAVLARSADEGADRPAAVLAADLSDRLEELLRDARAMPADAWDVLVTALAGWRHPAWYTLRRCLRELETHHLDLRLGHRTADWPAAYVDWALDDTAAALRARGFAVSRLTATDLGRSWELSGDGPSVSGPGHALLGWLTGRTPAGALTADGVKVSSLPADGPLPHPPAWPMPPAPGWG